MWKDLTEEQEHSENIWYVWIAINVEWFVINVAKCKHNSTFDFNTILKLQ
jgi:hypothetical protein